eukprot:TRINITY_DN6287_c0_g1_i1.p1 TRINITY_DN6287_c0_g1~~TRINITY_DN6287_c0_g1_i1.p1  ORF type:complete len:398 (+),score=64.24 TRINITY_DN6287_c0_g1_i1:78-1271(+)
MEGYLLKEGAGLVTQYKKRYFVIHSAHLVYYRTQGDPNPVGSINLREVQITENSAVPHGFTISSLHLARSYNLAGESEADRTKWMESLTAASKAAGPLQPKENRSSVSEASDKEGQVLYSSTSGGTKVGLKDFQIVKVIGRGSFGKVLKVQRTGTDEIYAMKALRKDVVVRENMVQNTKAEKMILQNVQHPYIVKLHFAFQTKERLYLILDLLPGGELFFHLKKEGTFTLGRTRLYSAEIASALGHLHKMSIVYRDLKPENIVLDKEGHACLTDFGLAKTAIPETQQTYTFCGTPEYIAPEILQGTGHGKAVDWWALGVLTYEMLVGLPPFYAEDVEEMYALILGRPLEFPPGLPDEAMDVLSRFLDRDKDKRLQDCDEVRQQPFFLHIDWEKTSAA